MIKAPSYVRSEIHISKRDVKYTMATPVAFMSVFSLLVYRYRYRWSLVQQSSVKDGETSFGHIKAPNVHKIGV